MYKRDDIKELSFLFREKPLQIILSISEENNITSNISKITYITYAHTKSVISSIEKVGLIEFEKKGRIKIIKLTDKGKRLQEYLFFIQKLMEEK